MDEKLLFLNKNLLPYLKQRIRVAPSESNRKLAISRADWCLIQKAKKGARLKQCGRARTDGQPRK